MKQDEYAIVLPKSSRALKEFKVLYKRRKSQVEKAISKLKIYPTDISKMGIEKLKDREVGNYSIRVSKGDRIIYDVDTKARKVLLIRASKHDLYRLIK
ncbi:MAG: hypothetical protein HY424_02490 [Candidatus Levybacteria bacterium]|nr:hypothetical protein [Candidatus Levybacteria bacterium]